MKYAAILLAGAAAICAALLYLGAATKGNPSPTIHQATVDGNLQALERLIRAHANVNETNGMGESALHLAAEKGQSNVLSLLLKNGALVDSADADNRTPLHRAVFSGQLSAVETLLTAGANPNACGKHGTAVHVMVLCVQNSGQNLTESQEAILRLLHDKGADFGAQNKEGWTPLHLIAASKPTKIDQKDLVRDYKSDAEIPLILESKSFLLTRSSLCDSNFIDMPTWLSSARMHEKLRQVSEGRSAELRRKNPALLLLESVKMGMTNSGSGGLRTTSDARNVEIFKVEELVKTFTDVKGCIEYEKAGKFGAEPKPDLTTHLNVTPREMAGKVDTKSNVAGLIPLLIGYGADINATNSAGLSPIDLVAHEHFPSDLWANLLLLAFSENGAHTAPDMARWGELDGVRYASLTRLWGWSEDWLLRTQRINNFHRYPHSRPVDSFPFRGKDQWAVNCLSLNPTRIGANFEAAFQASFLNAREVSNQNEAMAARMAKIDPDKFDKMEAEKRRADRKRGANNPNILPPFNSEQGSRPGSSFRIPDLQSDNGVPWKDVLLKYRFEKEWRLHGKFEI